MIRVLEGVEMTESREARLLVEENGSLFEVTSVQQLGRLFLIFTSNGTWVNDKTGYLVRKPE